MNTITNIENLANKVKGTGWMTIQEGVKQFVQYVMEMVLKLEQEEQIGCKPYERTTKRMDYANGSYKRALSTSYGYISAITVPRLRSHAFVSKLLRRYKRRPLELDQTLLAWYLQGESCRDVKRSLHTFSQDVLSPQTVSRLLQNVDEYLLSWRQRELSSKLSAVWLDGFSIKVRVKHKVRSYVILAALGRHSDGHWEVLSFRLSESESEKRWAELLHQMHKRGMRTQIFIHDGAGGIREALRWDYPNVKTQRCLVHKLRNILDVITCEQHCQDIKNDFWSVYNAPTVEQAKERFHSFCHKWIKNEPRVVFTARSDWLSTISFFSLPNDIQSICRSTNMIEWFFRELRRRVKVINAFPTPQSCERIIFMTLLYIENVNLNKSENMLSLLYDFTQN